MEKKAVGLESFYTTSSCFPFERGLYLQSDFRQEYLSIVIVICLHSLVVLLVNHVVIFDPP